MTQITPRKIFSTGLAAICLYGVSALISKECSAASEGNAIRISFPLAGAVVSKSETIVKGELNLPSGQEVAVTVNGHVALISGTNFATRLPLNSPARTTEVSATVTDAQGKVLGKNSIHLTAEPPRGDLTLTWRASPVLGVAPLSVQFSAASRKEVARAELDLDGDGTNDWRGVKLAGLQFELSQPGLYFPTITVIDTEGNKYTETALVQVIDQKEFDALLQSKWRAMKDALRRREIEKAIDYIVKTRRDGYRKMFQEFTIPLAEIDKALTDIKFVRILGIDAEYDMRYTHNGQEMSGLVTFRLDEDGIWRIRFF